MASSVPHKRIMERNVWSIAGVSLAFVSVVLAGIDCYRQYVIWQAAASNPIHLLFAVFVALLAMVACVAWLKRIRLYPLYNSARGLLPTSSLASDQQPTPLYPRRQKQEPPLQQAPSITPIDQDALFTFAKPTNGERCFVLPKEGDPLVECQDRYALNAAKRCYAVADGVSGSFVPGPWAQIVAQSFVEMGGEIGGKEEFQRWLRARGAEWSRWIEQRWIRTINALSHARGEVSEDWSEEVRKGAQTTLVACTIVPQTRMVHVWAIGDTQFFLFRPRAEGSWSMEVAFPLTDPTQFGYRPDTLATLARPDLLDMAWERRKCATFPAQPRDLIVLASDTLARWIMLQVQQKTQRWVPLLTMTDQDEFTRIIRAELHEKRIEEDDDITMLVVQV